MPTDNAVSKEPKQKKISLTGDKLFKLLSKKVESQGGGAISKENHKQKTSNKKEADPRASLKKTNEGIAGVNKAFMLDLIKDAVMADSNPAKNPDEDCDMITALDTDNLTKIQFQFLEAARTNNLAVLDMIIQNRGCRLDVKNNLDRTALHLAAAQGCFEAVQLLVNAKAPVDIADKHGMTPLFWAAYQDYVQIVVLLIRSGASVQRKTKRGFTLLHILAKSDSIKTLETLVRSKLITNFQETDLNDYTPLMVATISASLKATAVLSRIGSLESHLDKTKKNVFHLAVLGGCSQVLEQLCKHEKTTTLINAFDDDLMAPIHYAIDSEDIDCLSILLKHGARVNIKSKNVTYPLITASQRGSVEIISLLLNNKARLSKINFAGNTALHISSMANQVHAVRYLLQQGADILALNKRLQAPLNAAVEQGSTEAAEVLILAGAPLDQVDRTAKHLLTLAALSGFVRIVDMIIKAQRWRLANPKVAAALARKYCPRKRRESADESGDDDEYVEEGEHEEVEESPSISEAETFVGRSSSASLNDDSSDSISCAETYSSGSDNGGDRERQGEMQYQTAESVLTATSLRGSTRDRLQRESAATGSVNDQNMDELNRSFPSSVQSPRSNSVPASQRTGGFEVNSPASQNGRADLLPSPAMPQRSVTPLSTFSSTFSSEYSLLTSNQSYAGKFQTFFFYISHKKLHREEWKALAKYWNFTEEQIQAIELQHTGDKQAYKEHGYRLLCIWMHGLSKDTDPLPLLRVALTAIGRNVDANKAQMDLYKATHGRISSKNGCHVS